MRTDLEPFMQEMADIYNVPYLFWITMDTKMDTIKEIVHLMSESDMVELLRNILWKQEKDLSVIGEYVKYDLLEEMTIRIIFEDQCRKMFEEEHIQKYLVYFEMMSESSY